MAVESAADREAFISADEFGEEVSWTSGAVTSAVVGIPSAGTLRLEQIEGPGVVATQAALLCAVSGLPLGATPGDAVTFRGAAHTVKAIEPDGTGMALVRLERDEED